MQIIKARKSRNAEEENLYREQVRSLLLKVLQEMVDFPDSVSVKYQVGDNTTIYVVDGGPENFGQILGKQGKTIQALRQIVLGMMARKGLRAIIEVPHIHKDR